MAKKQAHYRLDASLVEALEEKAKAEGITITELVTRYLRQGLGLPTKSDETIDIEQLEQRILERVSTLIHKDIPIDHEAEKRITERVSEVLLGSIEEKINVAIEKRIASNIHISVSEVSNEPQQTSDETLAIKDNGAEKENLQPASLQVEDVENFELSQKNLIKVRKTTSELVEILQKERPKGNWSNQKLRWYTLGNRADTTHTVGKCQFKYAEPRERTAKDRSLSWFEVVYPLPEG